MPVVEVMNYDKPVIASNLSIFQELIGDEINYFTISDDNKESAKQLAKRMSDYEQPTEGSYEKIKTECCSYRVLPESMWLIKKTC